MARRGDSGPDQWKVILPASLSAFITYLLAVQKPPPKWPLWIFLGAVVVGVYLLASSSLGWWPYSPRRLNLRVDPLDPEVLIGHVKLVLLVRNDGETGEFIARVPSTVRGLDDKTYRPGKLAWEGQSSDRVEIYGGGGEHVLVVADLDVHRRRLRFRGPTSSYTPPNQQQSGKEVLAATDSVEFVMEIREVESDRYVNTNIKIVFDQTNFPSLVCS